MTKETAKSYIKELLDYEEKNDMFYLTSRERREFHQIVYDVFDDKEETINDVLEIIDQMDKENEKCNGEISRLLLRIEHKDFRERVLALKGGEQE